MFAFLSSEIQEGYKIYGGARRPQKEIWRGLCFLPQSRHFILSSLQKYAARPDLMGAYR